MKFSSARLFAPMLLALGLLAAAPDASAQSITITQNRSTMGYSGYPGFGDPYADRNRVNAPVYTLPAYPANPGYIANPGYGYGPGYGRSSARTYESYYGPYGRNFGSAYGSTYSGYNGGRGFAPGYTGYRDPGYATPYRGGYGSPYGGYSPYGGGNPGYGGGYGRSLNFGGQNGVSIRF